jgi:hypothetical protein
LNISLYTNCTQEGATAPTPPTPVKLTCEQCFRKFLNADQQATLVGGDIRFTLERFCAEELPQFTEAQLQFFLVTVLGLSESAAAQLIQCLLDAGVQFSTGHG